MLSQIPRNPNFNPGVFAPNNYKAQILILGCVDTTRRNVISCSQTSKFTLCALRGRFCLLSLESFPIKEKLQEAGGFLCMWKGVPRFFWFPLTTFVIHTLLPQGYPLIRGSKIFIKAFLGGKQSSFPHGTIPKGMLQWEGDHKQFDFSCVCHNLWLSVWTSSKKLSSTSL